MIRCDRRLFENVDTETKLLLSEVASSSLWAESIVPGDPKTLTPDPWSHPRTGSTDCLTDRSTDYPYGHPLRTTPKQHRNNNK